jgi:formylglycine-generating enzyme required for sulfatase activity
MKYILLIVALFSFTAKANNISISNISLTGQNTTAGANNFSNFVMVKFNLSWENSWRTSVGPGNWDAAWVFVKYRTPGGDWQHANLNNTGNIIPSGTAIDIGLRFPSTPFNNSSNPGVGAFIYRSTNGSGTFTAVDVQLKWNYGSQSVTDNQAVEVQVFGLEMIYIPQGAFNVGGGGGVSALTSTTINTANATTPPSGTGSLGGQAGGYPTGQTAPSFSSWPNGYAGFYCMKYELSQQGYVDFLNSLTRTQQIARVASNISGTSVTNRYVMSNTTTQANRSVIKCDANIPASPAPVTFYCDQNGNNAGGDIDDGQCIAMNWIGSPDALAYFDWSGLRPMTELEFEKICRGPVLPVLNEYAWGNTTITILSGTVINDSRPDEARGYAGPNANIGLGTTYVVRAGLFADASTNRMQSGAAYYGVMEMTGNLNERTISISTNEGKNFMGNHGNGILYFLGDANETSWPSAISLGWRGGAYSNGTNRGYISDRATQDSNSNSRDASSAIRGVRSTQ